TGVDTTSYAARLGAVNVSLNGIANDGAVGELDNNLSDVENAIGGAGNDILIGNTARNRLDGRAGTDLLIGGSGNDTLVGRVAGLRNDVLRFGVDNYTAAAVSLVDPTRRSSDLTGVDTRSYAARVGKVNVSLDGIANDGAPGELDNNLSDVENAIGGAGDDALSGNAAGNRLDGRAGNDCLGGGAGNDTLGGGVDTNMLKGGTGNDTAVAPSSVDGMDRFFGGAGVDTVSYAARLGAVNVSLDGIANDGAPGEHDNNIDVENAIGGAGNDTLSGNTAVNKLTGG